ncbi:MAG TPA: tetratricopeptide repeat protein, partial [Thermoanaerobaculia bacterium]|nr:tetratricopeptide repeat protein [Thermoanaerobaculia bacterium]
AERTRGVEAVMHGRSAGVLAGWLGGVSPLTRQTRNMLQRILVVLLPVVVFGASSAHAQYVPPVAKNITNDGTLRQTNGPIPLPAADETWLLARSKHFVFISSADEKRTRMVDLELEKLASALTQVDSTFGAPSATPTRIFLFTRRRESEPYFEILMNRRDPEVSSVFVSRPDGGSMLINQESMLINQEYRWLGGDRTPMRDLMHYLMQTGDGHAPLWLEVGITECFSNATIRRGSIAAGEPVPKHVWTLARARRIPPPELFDVVRESDTYKVPVSQSVFYAESWAIVDWLIRNSPENGAAFFAFVHDLSHGVPVEAALEARYHRSLRDVDWAFSRSAFPRRSAWTITIPAKAIDTAVVFEPLDRASTLYELGHLLAGVTELSAEAERHFRAALDANPRHASSLAGLASLRYLAGKYGEAWPLFDRAVAADPNDVEIALAYAEALMQGEAGAPAQASDTAGDDDDILRFRKARSLVQRALAHRGDSGFPTGRAMGDLGTTYGVESDVAPGIVALEEACKLLPDRTDFALHLLAMYRRSGNRAKADLLFAQLEAAHKPQVSLDARAVIERAELMRANSLTQQQRFDEAAVVVHELAANTSDASARHDLEAQAAELTRVAARNRQIDAYARIIAQVNAGKYRDAIKALSEFLPTASDADIIRDARKLQKQLEAWKP